MTIGPILIEAVIACGCLMVLFICTVCRCLGHHVSCFEVEGQKICRDGRTRVGRRWLLFDVVHLVCRQRSGTLAGEATVVETAKCVVGRVRIRLVAGFSRPVHLAPIVKLVACHVRHHDGGDRITRVPASVFISLPVSWVQLC